MLIFNLVDTRAYFTAATSGISLYRSLDVNIPLQLNSHKLTIIKSAKYLNKIDRDSIYLSPKVKSILIGVLLSDGWIQSRKGWNPRIGFKQSILHFEYLWRVYTELSYLISCPPYLCKTTLKSISTQDRMGGKMFFGVVFFTRQLYCLKEIRDLFYISNNGSNIWVRTLSPNIYYYFNNLALAHWIMGDGTRHTNGGLYLCTNALNNQELVLLINIFILKYDLIPSLHSMGGSRSNEYRIYIPKLDLQNKIRPNVEKYFVPSMLYKII